MAAASQLPYELVSHWRVPGRVDQVYAVLTDSAALPCWWPAAYHQVRELSPGDASGQGRVAQIVTRGRLLYALHWRLEVVETVAPERIRVNASRDVSGIGEWLLRQEGDDTILTYAWRVRIEKRWMRLLEPLLRPLYRFNHGWVMRQGEAGLRQDMARRAKPPR